VATVNHTRGFASFTNIVLATDGSEHADRAFRYAAEIARPSEAMADRGQVRQRAGGDGTSECHMGSDSTAADHAGVWAAGWRSASSSSSAAPTDPVSSMRL
jgi:hypothetical protein